MSSDGRTQPVGTGNGQYSPLRLVGSLKRWFSSSERMMALGRYEQLVSIERQQVEKFVYGCMQKISNAADMRFFGVIMNVLAEEMRTSRQVFKASVLGGIREKDAEILQEERSRARALHYADMDLVVDRLQKMPGNIAHGVDNSREYDLILADVKRAIAVILEQNGAYMTQCLAWIKQNMTTKPLDDGEKGADGALLDTPRAASGMTSPTKNASDPAWIAREDAVRSPTLHSSGPMTTSELDGNDGAGPADPDRSDANAAKLIAPEDNPFEPLSIKFFQKMRPYMTYEQFDPGLTEPLQRYIVENFSDAFLNLFQQEALTFDDFLKALEHVQRDLLDNPGKWHEILSGVTLGQLIARGDGHISENIFTVILTNPKRFQTVLSYIPWDEFERRGNDFQEMVLLNAEALQNFGRPQEENPQEYICSFKEWMTMQNVEMQREILLHVDSFNVILNILQRNNGLQPAFNTFMQMPGEQVRFISLHLDAVKSLITALQISDGTVVSLLQSPHLEFLSQHVEELRHVLVKARDDSLRYLLSLEVDDLGKILNYSASIEALMNSLNISDNVAILLLRSPHLEFLSQHAEELRSVLGNARDVNLTYLLSLNRDAIEEILNHSASIAPVTNSMSLEQFITAANGLASSRNFVMQYCDRIASIFGGDGNLQHDLANYWQLPADTNIFQLFMRLSEPLRNIILNNYQTLTNITSGNKHFSLARLLISDKTDEEKITRLKLLLEEIA